MVALASGSKFDVESIEVLDGEVLVEVVGVVIKRGEGRVIVFALNVRLMCFSKNKECVHALPALLTMGC